MFLINEIYSKLLNLQKWFMNWCLFWHDLYASFFPLMWFYGGVVGYWLTTCRVGDQGEWYHSDDRYEQEAYGGSICPLCLTGRGWKVIEKTQGEDRAQVGWWFENDGFPINVVVLVGLPRFPFLPFNSKLTFIVIDLVHLGVRGTAL